MHITRYVSARVFRQPCPISNENSFDGTDRPMIPFRIGGHCILSHWKVNGRKTPLTPVQIARLWSVLRTLTWIERGPPFRYFLSPLPPPPPTHPHLLPLHPSPDFCPQLNSPGFPRLFFFRLMNMRSFFSFFPLSFFRLVNTRSIFYLSVLTAFATG